MEQAEHEMLRHLGLSVVLEEGDVRISWPRVSASCDYRNPARFEDVLQIEVTITEVGHTSVNYGFHFTRGNERVATGSITAVCCRVQPDGSHRAIRIPARVGRKLRGEAETAEEVPKQ
jgi:4-hydroxybenzoyl-CoA thioesterase/acyl-CoA thioester hydrolase